MTRKLKVIEDGEGEHDEEPEVRVVEQPKDKQLPSVTLIASPTHFEISVSGPITKENAEIVFQLTKEFRENKKIDRDEVG